MSPALDSRQASAFYGSMQADSRHIQGMLVNLPLGSDFQGKPPDSPQGYNLIVEPDRLRIRLPNDTHLFKLYNSEQGQVEPLDPTHPHRPPVVVHPRPR
jgi:hypothetical protein